MQKIPFRFLFGFIALAIITASTINTSIVARQSSDENLYANQKQGVIFIQIIPGGVSDDAGLRVGDRLVKINGVEINSAMHAQSFLDRAKPGDSLTYTIERDGRIFDVNVNLALAGVRIWQVAVFVTGLFFLLYGLFVALSQPDNGKARLLALGMMMLGLFFMNIPLVSNISERYWLYRLYSLFLLLNFFQMVAVVMHASLYFPTQKYDQIKRFRMIYIHYIVMGIFAIISLYEILKIGPYVPVLLIPAGIYAVIFELVYFRKRRKEYRARSRVVLGSLTAMLILGVLGFICQFLFPNLRLVESLSFVIILLPIAYFYTTIKYRVFDISVRVRLSIVYTTLQIILLFLFLVTIIILIRWLSGWSINLPGLFITGTSLEIRDTASLPPDLQVQVQRGYLILAGVILTAFLYFFKQWLQHFFEKIFYQQKYDYRRALKNFVEILSASFRRDEISHRSLDQITSIMRIKGAMLLIQENGSFRVNDATGSLAESKNRKFELNDQILERFQHKKTEINQHDLADFQPLDALRDNIYHGISIISGGKRLEALLFTGEKLSESPYNTEDLELLDLFAEHLGSAFERARLYEEMADKERIEREIEIAREIQINSLPGKEPTYPGLQICASLSAAAEVGGDYYDYIQIDQNRLGIIIGDVVGKGTSAAFHMSKIQGFVRALTMEDSAPDKMLRRLNGLIEDNFDPDFFCTALYGIFDTRRRQLRLFRLGHSGLIYYNARQQTSELIEPAGLGLGIGDNLKFAENLESAEITYKQGDIFVFLTDGFTEAMNEHMEPYGEENLCRLVRENAQLPASDLMQKMVADAQRYSKGKWFDDATGIVVKITK